MDGGYPEVSELDAGAALGTSEFSPFRPVLPAALTGQRASAAAQAGLGGAPTAYPASLDGAV